MIEHEVTYEVWRTHRKGPDVLVQGRTSEPNAAALLKECKADKAARYPDAPIDFYLARATTTREKL